MDQAEPLIRNISDTARWAAVFRARENERPDALFRDPFAARLAGERGQHIADSMPDGYRNAWAWVTRTYAFDQIITQQVAQGVDMVVNLAAGLDARPYRLALPSALRWIEVDLPELLAYKQDVLGNEKPTCALEQIPLDLANVAARRDMLQQVTRSATKALVITEGLLVYLSREEVATLAQDLAGAPSIRLWALEVASPGLLRMLQKHLNQPLGEGGARLQFGPEEGPGFFAPHGWQPLEVHSMLKTAARLGRLTLFMRLLSLLPESHGKQGSRPWSAVCLLGRS